MANKSIFSKAWKIYSEQGLLKLLNRTSSYAHYKIHPSSEKIIMALRQVKTKRHQINLNGVIVSVEVSPVDKYAPFYEPPYPTESNPEYEHTEVESLRTYAKKGDSVVVIGGGLGVTAVVASKITDGEVTVFEQSKPTYRILNRTIELNNCSDAIKTELKAVGEAAGSTFTHDVPSGVDRIPPSELPYADVYEMDCEGAETTILQEMNVKPSTLLIETHNNHDDVCEILDNIGYDIVEVVDNGKGQHHSCTHIRAQLSE